MPSVTVALLGSRELGRELGKRGTQSDLTLYDSVRDGHVATYIEPTQFPEKLAPLLYAIAMSERALFVVPALNREVAEIAATLDLFPRAVDLVAGPGVGPEELDRAFQGLSIAAAPRHPQDPPHLRALVESWQTDHREGATQIWIDHAFPVKGVGAVALGVVRQGTVRSHDRLRLYPTDRSVEIRSIQVHDVDVPDAPTGARVGLALKGIEASELARGQVLAPDGTLAVAVDLSGTRWRRGRYARGELESGSAVHLSVGLQFVPARLGVVSADAVELRADRPLAFEPGSPGYLADLSVGTGPRVLGSVRIAPAVAKKD